MLRQVNFFLTSERVLSDRIQALFGPAKSEAFVSTFHIWDVARLQRQRNSRGRQRAAQTLISWQLFGDGISMFAGALRLQTPTNHT